MSKDFRHERNKVKWDAGGQPQKANETLYR